MSDNDCDNFTVTYNNTNTYIFRKNTCANRLLAMLERKTGVPKNAIVLYTRPTVLLTEGYNTKPYQEIDSNSHIHDNLIMKIRPLVGDHVHIIHSFWVFDGTYKLISPLKDIYPVTTHNGGTPSEPTDYYLLNALNAGVHTHGDGFIHIHPFTAPAMLSDLAEGLNCTLKLYFPVIGVTYKTVTNLPSIQFNENVNFINYKDVDLTSGYTYVDSDQSEPLLFDPDDSLQWYLFIWDNYTDFKNKRKPKIFVQDISNIWLYRNAAVFIFGYFPKNQVIDNIPRKLISQVYQVTSGQIAEFIKYHSH